MRGEGGGGESKVCHNLQSLAPVWVNSMMTFFSNDEFCKGCSDVPEHIINQWRWTGGGRELSLGFYVMAYVKD